MESVRALDDFRGLALLQPRGRVHEQLRQSIGVAPAEIAAFEGIASIRVGGRGLTEIGAGAQLPQHVFGAVAAGRDLFCGGVFRYPHQDLAEVDFFLRIGAGSAAQVGIDFGISDLDLFIDFLLAQTLDRDLFADLLAKK